MAAKFRMVHNPGAALSLAQRHRRALNRAFKGIACDAQRHAMYRARSVK